MRKIIITVFLLSILLGCKKISQQETLDVNSSSVSSSSSNRISTPSILQWQKCLGTPADEYGWGVAKAGDGGYFVTGTISTNNDGYLVKLDANHNVVRTVTFGGSGTDNVYGIVSTDDGGCLIAGRTTSPEIPGVADAHSILLAKFDVNGYQEWIKAIGRSGSQALAIIKTSDNNFALTGYSAEKLPFIKIDPQGNVLQEAYYTYSPATAANFGNAITEAADGYIISGWTHVAGTTAEDGLLVVKVLNDGTTTGTRFYTGISAHGYGITSNATKTEFAITGINGNLFVLKIDGQINKIKDNTYGSGEGRSIVTTGDGFLIAGGVSGDLMLLRIDNNLNKISSNTFGGGRDEVGRCIIADTDGYAIAGTTNSNNGDVSGNHGGNDMWVVKVKY